jgi:Ni/Co efflux regulator RcnB
MKKTIASMLTVCVMSGFIMLSSAFAATGVKQDDNNTMKSQKHGMKHRRHHRWTRHHRSMKRHHRSNHHG